MSRHKLMAFTNKRIDLTGTFVRFSASKTNKLEATVLFTDVNDARGERVSDHLWLEGSPFQNLKLQTGDRVRFNAKIIQFVQGYSELDRHLPIDKTWKASAPRHIRIVQRADGT